jgi:hypothetical protein
MLMIDCVYYVFTSYFISNLLVLVSLILTSLLYELESYDVYALTLIIMVHVLSIKQ